MRPSIRAIVGVGLLLLLTGCDHWATIVSIAHPSTMGWQPIDYYIAKVWPPTISFVQGDPNNPFYFQGWTSNRRYAIFYGGSHYGPRWAEVFDVWNWNWFNLAGPFCQTAMGGVACQQAAIAIAPKTSRLFLGDGQVVNLDDLNSIKTNPAPQSDQALNRPVVASWSPDETYLLFVYDNTGYDVPTTYYLYIADGTGLNSQMLMQVDNSGTFTWSPDDKTVTYTTNQHTYVINLALATSF
jgi:hypothetical protein